MYVKSLYCLHGLRGLPRSDPRLFLSIIRSHHNDMGTSNRNHGPLPTGPMAQRI